MSGGVGGEEPRGFPLSRLFGSISEKRELTVWFDDEGRSARRPLSEPCPKNQGRNRAIDCGHLVEWSGDQFLSQLFIERR